jgi:hypothetical protein
MDAVTSFLRPYSPTAFGVAIIVGLAVLVYRSALPKPIPGIPYDKRAAKNLFGSLPDMISYMKMNGVIIPWLTSHNAKHGAPLVQFFGAPFSKPTLVLSDFHESQDILLRRTKEFDRAARSLASFEGSIPNHHIAMRTADPRFKGNKELVRDLMSPNFLADVRSCSLRSPNAVPLIWENSRRFPLPRYSPRPLPLSNFGLSRPKLRVANRSKRARISLTLRWI